MSSKGSTPFQVPIGKLPVNKPEDSLNDGISGEVCDAKRDDTGLGRGADGSSSEILAPRYIPLPDSIFRLRRRFPSVLSRVFLECTLCHQWIAVEVLPSIPEEQLMAPAASSEAVQRVQAHLGTSRVAQSQEATEVMMEKAKWHSPRLQSIEKQYSNSNAVHSDHGSGMTNESDGQNLEEKQLLRTLKLVTSQPSGRSLRSPAPPLFIPNPANFVCSWSSCVKADQMLDLRHRWLGDLYHALEACEKERVRGGDPLIISEVRDSGNGNQARDNLNNSLARELSVRRSERLASKRQRLSHEAPVAPHSREPVTNELDLIDDTEDVRHRTEAGWLQMASQRILRRSDTTLSAFCWVVCDRCGKIRRTSQPFPFGAPFICALASNVGSCSVPEMDAIITYSANYTEQELHRAVLSAPELTFPLKQQYARLLAHDTGAFPSASSSQKSTDTATCRTSSPILLSEPLLKAVRSNGAKRFFHSVPGGGDNRSVSTTDVLELECLPLLKELGAVVRKKAIGPFVKQVLLTPAEIRAKREEVLRKSCDVAGDPLNVKAEAQQSITSDMQPVVHKRGRPSKPSSAQSKDFLTQRKQDVPIVCEESAPRKRACATSDKGNAQETCCHSNTQTQETIMTGDDAKATACDRATTESQVSTVVLTLSPTMDGDRQLIERHDLASHGTEPRRRGRARRAVPAADGTGMIDSPRESHRKHRSSHRSSDVISAHATDVAKVPLNPAAETIYWVQCDRCGKWRVVPKPVDNTIPFWECTMRDSATTCDTMDDEERLKLEGVKI